MRGMNEHEGTVVAFLADRDETCPVCQYNLRGLTRAVCPECGVALRMGVVAEGGHGASWVKSASNPALLLAAAMLLGLAAFGWRGSAGVLVVWVWVMMGLGLKRKAAVYYATPLDALGDLVWRAFVILVMGVMWIAGEMFAMKVVMLGV